MTRQPVPTRIAGGSKIVNDWLGQWHQERQELEALERDLENITDLAMERFPKKMVRETKDIEELIMAAGAKIKRMNKALKKIMVGLEGDDEDFTAKIYAIVEKARR